MSNPIKRIKYIGESITIAMEHRQTGETNIFEGIISNISMVGSHGTPNYISIQGDSPSIRLGGESTMNSFVDKTLDEIIGEIINDSGHDAPASIDSRYKYPIDYICQYGENTFDFINRLSYLYGETFYYDGSTTHFGKLPMGNVISASIYTEGATTLAARSNIDTVDSLLDMVNVERQRTVANMLKLNATTQTCKVKIGGVVSIEYPLSMGVDTNPGNFIVTEVVHSVDQEGHYSNNFSGVSAAPEQIPVTEIDLPLANSQRAKIVSNNDPEGRGRVLAQFQWQRYLGKSTNWIRVQTPDAGSSNIFRHNRGFVFIPEEGDEVMIGFENLDPSKPFVSGSLFSINKGEGGGDENHLKTIKTRNGHRIELDDSAEGLGITIKDKNDNMIHFDTNNKSILIKSIEKVDIVSTVINLTADEINLSSKNTISTSREKLAIFAENKISIHSDDTLDMESFNILNIEARESYFKGKDILEASAQTINIGAESDALISGNTTTLNGETSIKIKAPDIQEMMQTDVYPFKEKVIKREAIMSNLEKR